MAWGSRAALAYCSLNPSRVLSAAFNDASIGAADVKAQQRGGKKAVEFQLKSGIQRFPKPEGWNVHNKPELVPQKRAAAARFNLPEAVTAFTMPVLAATGDHDPNLASSRDLVDTASNARLEDLENVGHGSVLLRPDLAARTFMQFQESLAPNHWHQMREQSILPSQLCEVDGLPVHNLKTGNQKKRTPEVT